MTAVRYDPFTGTSRVASQPGPDMMVWTGSQWVKSFACPACKKPGIKHPHHSHCTSCVAGYQAVDDAWKGKMTKAPDPKAMQFEKSPAGQLARDLNATIGLPCATGADLAQALKQFQAAKAAKAVLVKNYYDKVAVDGQVVAASGFPCPNHKAKMHECGCKVLAEDNYVVKCGKCGFVGKHDSEDCFGRWLSTPKNDPPAHFVASAKIVEPRKGKFEIGEKLIFGDTGDLVQVMDGPGVAGNYAVVTCDEGEVKLVLPEKSLRIPTKRDLAALAQIRQS